MPVLKLINYQNVLEEIVDKPARLLVGNGFSISCDPIFSYPSLYEKALEKGLSAKAVKVFEYLGENNFEGVMRTLDFSHKVAHIYGLVGPETSELLEDVEKIKTALIEALTDSHLKDSTEVSDDKKKKAQQFLKPYHSIFTTNYDLLLYWVNMYDTADKAPRYKDGFGSDSQEPDAGHVVYAHTIQGRSGLYYLHGGLHLFINHGQICKHCWNRAEQPLIQLVKEGLERKNYPLFVSEGTPAKKREQIANNAYLSYVFSKFTEIQSPLVIYGHGMNESDEHIIEAIANNRKLSQLFIGTRDPNNQRLKAVETKIKQLRRDHDLPAIEIKFFDSSTVQAWE